MWRGVACKPGWQESAIGKASLHADHPPMCLKMPCLQVHSHYNDAMSAMASQSPASRLFTQPFVQGANQRKHQSSALLAFVRGIHRWPVNSPHKG